MPPCNTWRPVNHVASQCLAALQESILTSLLYVMRPAHTSSHLPCLLLCTRRNAEARPRQGARRSLSGPYTRHSADAGPLVAYPWLGAIACSGSSGDEILWRTPCSVCLHPAGLQHIFRAAALDVSFQPGPVLGLMTWSTVTLPVTKSQALACDNGGGGEGMVHCPTGRRARASSVPQPTRCQGKGCCIGLCRNRTSDLIPDHRMRSDHLSQEPGCSHKDCLLCICGMKPGCRQRVFAY